MKRYYLNWLTLMMVAVFTMGLSSCTKHDKDDLNPPVDDPENGNSQENNSQIDGGHEAVDLGLSVKWASCNIGASSPEDIGDYYAWAETSTKRSYTDRTWLSADVSNEGDMLATVGTDEIIGTKHDVAHVKWGNGWRMPLKSEYQEMVDKCTSVITTRNGAKVAKITGPNGNSIFMPLGGEIEDRTVIGKGESGYYWSANMELGQPKAFRVDEIMWANVFLRYSFGANVRAVHEY